MDICGVILDVDGTLIDSNDAHARAWQQALQFEGIKVPISRVRRLIGMGGDKLIHILTGFEDSSPEGKRISRVRREIFRARFFPELRLFPTEVELLRRMNEEGLVLAVASSASISDLEDLLKRVDPEGRISIRVSKDDVGESKPAPDSIYLALKKMKLSPDEVLMLGDTPYDIEGATRAGVKTVALRSGGWDDIDLRGAIAIYDDAEDLLEKFGFSPFARKVRAAA